MTQEEIERLLKKYETKQPGEIWDTETDRLSRQEYDKSQKLFLLDILSTNPFRLREGQKARARYIVEKLNFSKICGKCNSEQIIVMIIIYVKLEYNPSYHISRFENILREYDIGKDLFISFLVKLNKFHINKDNYFL